MTRPQKNPKTGVYYFRQKTPADLRTTFGKGEVIRSLGTKDPEAAKIRCAEEAIRQANVWKSLRAAPSAIPHKHLMALVGTYRRNLDAMMEIEPGEALLWETLLRVEASNGSTSKSLERWAGSDADALLQEAGLAADPHSRLRLIKEMHKVRVEWATYQHRRSLGDYRPDDSAERFPEWVPVNSDVPTTARGPSGETITGLFELWERQHLKAGKSKRTVGDFRAKIDSLCEHLGHDDASRVKGREVDEWCDKLLASGLTEKTVGEKYLAAVKAVFKLAVEKFRLGDVPSDGVARR